MLYGWPFLNGKREGIILDMQTPYLIVSERVSLALKTGSKYAF
jgi:hypothetical protein